MNTTLKRVLSSGVLTVGAGMLARHLIRSVTRDQFRGRLVVITGGSRGLGLILARLFAAEGARLAICARDEHELKIATSQLKQYGGVVFSSVCDLCDEQQLTEFLSVVQQSQGPVDVLINNAGMIQVGPLESMTVEDFDEALQLHFWAPLHATLQVLPEMRRRQTGRIVTIVSIGEEVAVPQARSLVSLDVQ